MRETSWMVEPRSLGEHREHRSRREWWDFGCGDFGILDRFWLVRLLKQKSGMAAAESRKQNVFFKVFFSKRPIVWWWWSLFSQVWIYFSSDKKDHHPEAFDWFLNFMSYLLFTPKATSFKWMFGDFQWFPTISHVKDLADHPIDSQPFIQMGWPSGSRQRLKWRHLHVPRLIPAVRKLCHAERVNTIRGRVVGTRARQARNLEVFSLLRHPRYSEKECIDRHWRPFVVNCHSTKGATTKIIRH